MVNDVKKTWKAFINGKRIYKVSVSENEYIPSILSIADFDSLLEHLTMLSPDTLLSGLEVLPKGNETNKHLLTGVSKLVSLIDTCRYLEI